MWENILKRRRGGNRPVDIKTIKYIMRDGKFRSVEALIEEIYELVEENKKIGYNRLSNQKRNRERPRITRFEMYRGAVSAHMTNSPDEYESRDTGNKTFSRRPIIEFKYIGG
jgi:hypothetical protein